MHKAFTKLAGPLLAVTCLGVGMQGLAYAQDWPAKPIRLIAPFPPGGPADGLTRYLGQKLSERVGQPVVVDNVPGAGGGIAMQRLARAEPDGYTLGFTHVGTLAINPHIYATIGYDPVKDFTPVAGINEYENVLVVNPALPYKSVQDLIDAAKAKPGFITYGSAGNGASNHLSGALLASMSGAEFSHVPYKGSAPALVDVMGGTVDFMFDIIITSKQHIESGRLRALATTGRERSAELPDVPVLSETLPGYEVIGWGAIAAPSGTPDAIVQKLAKEFETIVASDESAELFKRQGFTQAYRTPEALGEYIGTELERWGRIVKESGAQIR